MRVLLLEADCLDRLEDALAHPRLANLAVGPHQFDGVAPDHWILLLLERCARFAETLAAMAGHRATRQRIRRHLIEKVGDRHVQYLGELEQTARGKTKL